MCQAVMEVRDFVDLDDVIVQSRDQHMSEVQGIALHSRAALAHQRGENQEAVQLLHEALNLTTKPSDRDVVLGVPGSTAARG